MTGSDIKQANRRTAKRLGVVVLAMFGFGFALVPLYNVFCEITGLNGKTGVVEARSLDGGYDESRLVTVEFVGTVNSSLPWEFGPVRYKMQVHPHDYEIKVSYLDDIYNVEIQESRPGGAIARDIRRKDLRSCSSA